MTDVFRQALTTPQVARWTAETAIASFLMGTPLEQSDDWSDPYGSEALLDVHGGVTFGPKKVAGGHIVGFDTAHFTDYSAISNPSGRRWMIDDLIAETNRMAEQIARAGVPHV